MRLEGLTRKSRSGAQMRKCINGSLLFHVHKKERLLACNMLAQSRSYLCIPDFTQICRWKWAVVNVSCKQRLRFRTCISVNSPPPVQYFFWLVFHSTAYVNCPLFFLYNLPFVYFDIVGNWDSGTSSFQVNEKGLRPSFFDGFRVPQKLCRGSTYSWHFFQQQRANAWPRWR